jgi:hypothetical protein
MYPALHRMETALMSNFGRKAAIAAVAFATVGSTVFGGAALANGDKDKEDHKKVSVWKAGDAKSGDATAACEYEAPLIEVLGGPGGLANLLRGGTVTNDQSCTASSGPATGGGFDY